MIYPRNLIGYGRSTPKFLWPDNNVIAIQFVVNYEEGGENNILHGDEASEAFLSEVVGAIPWKNQRHWNMETIYEYGSRAGFWRLLRLFEKNNIPVTVYGVATALQRSPEQVLAMQEANWEIASHGFKWVEYKDVFAAQEREHIRKSIKLHEAVTGERPLGWYTGRCSINTVDLVTEIGGFEYISDSYADDLPYWHSHKGRNQLIIPYTLDTNDMRFATAQGFNAGDQFLNYLTDSFDMLYQEGLAGYPKILNIGLHCRLAGRPGRCTAIQKFIDYVQKHENVWFAKRIEIANFWKQSFPPQIDKLQPSNLSRDKFISLFGNIFENSPWIAEKAYDSELSAAHDTVHGFHSLLTTQFRLASGESKLEVLRAHPELATSHSEKDLLSANSISEQSGAKLNKLSSKEQKTFNQLNQAYMSKFGFPFILAIKGLSKIEIQNCFETRLSNDSESEFNEACKQVEKIALLRIIDIFS